MKLKNRISLITGSSRGIGRAIAIEYAKEGSTIALNYNKNHDMAERTCKKVRDLNSDCLLLQGDVSNIQDAKRMVNTVLDKYKKVDVLVNNAGIMTTNTSDYMDLEEMVKTNLYSMVYMIEELRHNFEFHGGKIINISSVAGIGTALKGTTFYSITKGAVIALTRRYAFDLGKFHVNVNAIAPGYIDTDLTRKPKSKEEWKKVVREISSRTSLGRIGTAGDISKAALFLASDDSDFITGQVIVVDGGRLDFLSHSL
ncbi:MAG: SDR family NAD(P)-dependent oxidoreductase [Thermoplasmata archaeon]